MIKNLQTVKRIIRTNDRDEGLYISLIDEDGRIQSVNSKMSRSLEIKNPKQEEINFFELLHPMNIDAFRNCIKQASLNKECDGVELYVKNGQYHPMKWKIINFGDSADKKNTFCCVGYKIMDDIREKQFNQLVKNHSQLIRETFNGVLFQDQNGEFIAVNQGLTRIFDTTLENIYQLKNIKHLWKTEWDVLDEEGNPVPYEQAPFAKTLESGHPEKKTLCIRSRSGDYKWVVLHSQSLSEAESGDQPFVVSNITDITLERELKAQLKEKDAIVNAFFNNTPTLAWVVDQDAYVYFLSNAFCKFFNIDEKDFHGKKMSDLVHVNTFNALYKNHMAALTTNKSVNTSLTSKLADGSNQVYFINIFPIHMPSGKTLIGGHSTTLPSQGSLEKELRITHERLLHFTNATTDAIWEWDMQSGVIYRNESLMEMIGYQPDNSRGLSWWLRRIHPDDRNRVADRVKDATDLRQQSWQDEYRFKCADGNYKHIQDKGYVVYENNLPVRMIGSLHDVSKFKELQTILADERLKRQVEITDTIIQVQEKERTRLGYELHDNVNQILSTAGLFVNMIKPTDPDQLAFRQKSMDYIQLAVEEIRKLSKELVAPQLREERLTECIRSLVNDLHLTKALEIDFVSDSQADQVCTAKKVTLFRVVQEQLKNILNHSEATTAEILLRVKGNQVELSITDNGKGFDPLQTPRGIGLSNIHERTRFYNGTVVVKASKGYGCTLKVSIPLDY